MTTPSRNRWATLVLVSTLAAGLAGCGQSPAVSTVPPAAVPSTSPVSPTPRQSAPARAARGPQPLPAPGQVTVTSVVIDSIDVRTTKLEQLALDPDGALAAPKDPDRAGWYAGGTVPGDVGPAVIAGHVDSKTGPAVFYDLRDVGVGDKVRVRLSNRSTTTFVVDRVLNTPKKGFPTEEVFGPTPDAQLRLITCGGPYDRTVGSYTDNTVVFATAVAGPVRS